MQIRSTAYTLTQLLALQLWESFPLMAIAPWRKGAMITAGLFGQSLRMQFIEQSGATALATSCFPCFATRLPKPVRGTSSWRKRERRLRRMVGGPTVFPRGIVATLSA